MHASADSVVFCIGSYCNPVCWLLVPRVCGTPPFHMVHLHFGEVRAVARPGRLPSSPSPKLDVAWPRAPTDDYCGRSQLKGEARYSMGCSARDGASLAATSLPRSRGGFAFAEFGLNCISPFQQTRAGGHAEGHSPKSARSPFAMVACVSSPGVCLYTAPPDVHIAQGLAGLPPPLLRVASRLP